MTVPVPGDLVAGGGRHRADRSKVGAELACRRRAVLVLQASIAGSTLTVTLASGGPLTFNLQGAPAATRLNVSGSDVTVAAPLVDVWTGAQNTVFANAANWDDISNNLTPAAVAPGSLATAQFDSGGSANASSPTEAIRSFS